MEHVLIIHQVKDYAAWKLVFDRAADIRRAAGERGFLVLRDEHDPNRIVHFATWSSLGQARAFFESAELVRIRQEAGVEAPDFNYLTLLERGTL